MKMKSCQGFSKGSCVYMDKINTKFSLTSYFDVKFEIFHEKY